MLIDVWDLPAIDALDDELAFRIRPINVSESPLCAVQARVATIVRMPSWEATVTYPASGTK